MRRCKFLTDTWPWALKAAVHSAANFSRLGNQLIGGTLSLHPGTNYNYSHTQGYVAIDGEEVWVTTWLRRRSELTSQK